MARKRKVEPRKRPRQERAQVTVEAIVIAAEQVLEKDGLDRLTTARVAEVAGVSVGSLYQYFPSKEAILAVLIDRMNARTLAQARQVLEASRVAPLADVARIGMRALVENYTSGRARLVQPLVDARSDAGRAHTTRKHLDAIVELVSDYLMSRQADLRVSDVRTAAYVIVNAVDGVSMAIAQRLPDRDEAERLITQLSELVTLYLVR